MIHINNLEFALNKSETSGSIDLLLCDRIDKDLGFCGVLNYKLHGDMDNKKCPTLILQIYGIIYALCQSCLESMEYKLDNTNVITIFKNEQAMDNALFSNMEDAVVDGVLANKEFNLLEFIEDEIILLLPYAPKHDNCSGLKFQEDNLNPFIILKTFMREK